MRETRNGERFEVFEMDEDRSGQLREKLEQMRANRAELPRRDMKPDDWWEAFEMAAIAANLSVSEWLGEAGKAMLSPKIVEKLSERQTSNIMKALREKKAR